MVRKIEGFHKKQVQGGINTFRSKLTPLHRKTIFYAKIGLCPNIPTAKVSALSLLFVLPPSTLPPGSWYNVKNVNVTWLSS